MSKILIIEDDSDFRAMLKTLLSRAAYTVIESKDGCEGLKMASQELPDLIITDIVMPNQDGIGAIMTLTKQFPGIKIIAISGGGLCQPHLYLKMAKALGAKQIFEKPLNNNEFLEAVHTLINENNERT